MSVDNKVPEIRFKGFGGAWKRLTLGDLGSVAMNKRIFKHQTTITGDVPFFKIGTFGKQPDAFISKELFYEYKDKYPYPVAGDLLLSASGSIGRVVEYKGEEHYFQDSNIVWLKHDGKIDNAFLKVFYSMVKWSGLEGSTIKRLYNKNILDTEISIPERQEQIAIGNAFQKLDTLINQYQLKHDKLSNIKKAMLEKMFPKKGEAIPEIRFKGFSGEWEEKDLNNEVELFSGLTYSPSDIRKSGTLVLRSSNVKNGQLIEADNIYVNPEVVNCSNVVEGDIIVVVRNGSRSLIGKHAQVTSRMNNTVIGAFMTGIRSKQPAFINALLDTNMFTAEVEKNLGATINQITNGSFNSMVFMFPKEDEQQEIGNYFQKLDVLINQHKQQITKFNNIKQACLSKMFV